MGGWVDGWMGGWVDASDGNDVYKKVGRVFIYNYEYPEYSTEFKARGSSYSVYQGTGRGNRNQR